MLKIYFLVLALFASPCLAQGEFSEDEREAITSEVWDLLWRSIEDEAASKEQSEKQIGGINKLTLLRVRREIAKLIAKRNAIVREYNELDQDDDAADRQRLRSEAEPIAQEIEVNRMRARQLESQLQAQSPLMQFINKQGILMREVFDRLNNNRADSSDVSRIIEILTTTSVIDLTDETKPFLQRQRAVDRYLGSLYEFYFLPFFDPEFLKARKNLSSRTDAATTPSRLLNKLSFTFFLVSVGFATQNQWIGGAEFQQYFQAIDLFAKQKTGFITYQVLGAATVAGFTISGALSRIGTSLAMLVSRDPDTQFAKARERLFGQLRSKADGVPASELGKRVIHLLTTEGACGLINESNG